MIVNTYDVSKIGTYKGRERYKVKCLVCGKVSSIFRHSLYEPCSCVKQDDTVGKKYGDLFVYDKYTDDQKIYCKCICQLCGNKTTVLKSNLASGHTKSCGCLKRSESLEGKTFGNLVVSSRTEKYGRTYYYCLCTLCGTTLLKRADTIPQATSCGCDKRDAISDALRKKAFVDGTQPAKIQLDKTPTKANKSGVVGVCWDKSRGKWMASIRFKGKKYNLGRFDDIQDAIDARKEAEKKIFGEFLEWYETQQITQRYDVDDIT